MTRRWPLALALVLLGLVALGLRALAFPEVFPGHGLVELAIADSAYHARRALFSVVNFPHVLVWDPYLAFPDGAPVRWPPLYDWLLAAVARLFGDDQATFEHVAAWASPALGALTIVPVYFVGRELGGRRLGLGAAALLALLPVAARTASLGDVDHHAAVALLGATLLVTCLALLRAAASQRSLVGLVVWGALCRGALALTWGGSPLYLAVADGSLLAAAVFARRPRVFPAQAASLLGAAVLVAAWLGYAAPEGDAVFTTTNVSWFHVLLLLGLAAACAAEGLLAEDAGPLARLSLAAVVGLAAGGAFLLLFPALRETIVAGFGFVSKADPMAHANPEQKPLFFNTLRGPGRPFAVAHLRYGFFAWTIPFAALAVLLRARRPEARATALCVGLWLVGFGVLAIAQVRFGSDFAPVGAVGFAFLVAAVVRRARAPEPWSTVLALLLAGVMLAPALWQSYRPALAALGSERPSGLSWSRSINAFAREVRAATPETAGFFDPSARPEYGVLVLPTFGNVINYQARRPTPVGNFGPYLDREKYDAALRFYRVGSEREGLAIAEALGCRYVMTSSWGGAGPAQLADRLHVWDGVGPEGHPSVEHLRLVVEGPPGGRPMPRSGGRSGAAARTAPYKLFEIVAGAVLEVRGPPGAAVSAELDLASSLGRRFRYETSAVLGADGRARLRVPYATEPLHPTRALGLYRVRVDPEERRVAVPEEAVRAGRVIVVPEAPAPSG